MNWADRNCEGAGPHNGREVRLYPTGGGGNLILCCACWRRENRFRHERGQEYTAALTLFPTLDWTRGVIVARGEA